VARQTPPCPRHSAKIATMAMAPQQSEPALRIAAKPTASGLTASGLAARPRLQLATLKSYHLEVNTSARSRDAFHARVLQVTWPSKNRRGRRECRVMASPMARLQQIKQAAVTTGSAGSTGIPCAMVYGLYRALPGAPGFLATITSVMQNIIANLASASGCQDHTTSPSALATFVSRAIRVHRIPAPRIVTIGRNVPLHRGGMRESIVSICPTEQARTHAADWHDGQFAHGGCAGGACGG